MGISRRTSPIIHISSSSTDMQGGVPDQTHSNKQDSERVISVEIAS